MAGIIQTLVAASFCWFLSSSLWVYPHSLVYFNESIAAFHYRVPDLRVCYSYLVFSIPYLTTVIRPVGQLRMI